MEIIILFFILLFFGEDNIPFQGSGSTFAMSLYNNIFAIYQNDGGIPITYFPTTETEGVMALLNVTNEYAFAGKITSKNCNNICK